MLAARCDCICAIPAKPAEEHPAKCPVHQAYLDAPIGLHLADGVELAPLSTLPLVDWDNITKDPRLAIARMSNHPELASLGAP